ncbi:MAG: rod shape-determining protein RodA, partial [Bacteroidales bacterium]|nr:rod shape-determining protein RodA [Bacteroidales bacterium]
MERQEVSIFRRIDWQIVLIYLFLVIAGWVNIYSAVYDESMSSILDTGQKYGKQFIWILAAFFIAISILIIDSKLYYSLSYFFYGIVIVLLVAVYLFAPEIKGARSWVDLGWVRFQPSEFAKLTTSLVIARFLGEFGVKITRFSDALRVFIIMILPIALIVLQGDAGSALVFLSFFFVFYREGMPLSILLIGFGLILVFSLSIVWGSDVISIVTIGLGLLLFYVLYGLQKKQKLSFWVHILVTLAFVVPIGVYYVLKLELPTIIVFLLCFAILLVPTSVYVYKKRRYSLLLLFGLCLGAVLVSQSVGYV